MAPREASGTNIAPGLVSRIAAGFHAALNTWFGPGEPLKEVAPQAEGRQFDYPVGFNISTRPRGDEPITFERLRYFADRYDMLRLIIETRKDQLVKMTWTIQRKDRKKAGNDPRIKEVTDFLEMPDKEHDWDTWLRMVVEDMLVIDAATIYPRRTVGGKIYALDTVDGATIKRVLDERGRTPLPPFPAYQQILKGMPAVDYTREELHYLARNVRTNRVYGFSPVEQVMMTVEIAILRQNHQKQYYTEGNVPEALIAVPETWTPDQIAQFQAYWDSLLEGDTAQRRHAKFVPASIAKGYVQTKEAALKDEYDEWLARIICYAFNVTNQWAVKQMNRATADTAAEQAAQEGLGPLQRWIKGVMDRCLREDFGYPDLEFSWSEEVAIDPSQEAEINEKKVKCGRMTLDDWAALDGQDPLPDGLGAEPLIYTATGAVRLRDIVNPPAPPPQPSPNGNLPMAGSGEDPLDPESLDEPEIEDDNGQAGLAKMAADRPDLQAEVSKLEGIWVDFLKAEGKKVAEAVAKSTVLAKADQPDLPDPSSPTGVSATDASEAATTLDAVVEGTVDALVNQVINPTEWQAPVDKTVKVLTEVAKEGAKAEVKAASAQSGIAYDVTRLANKPAEAWAETRSGELVSGLTDTSRAQLRALIAESQKGGWSIDRLSRAIEESQGFSPERAHTIAQFETFNAYSKGALAARQKTEAETGIKYEKSWRLGIGENHCPACLENVAAGWIPLNEEFPSGAQTSPGHPHCTCGTNFRVKGYKGVASSKAPFDLAKYNPNHDGRGRFAMAAETGGGGGVVDLLSGNRHDVVVVAKLPADIQAHLGSKSSQVLLSGDSRDGHRHHEWTAEKMGRLQAVLDHGEIRSDRDRHIVAAHHDGAWWYAAVKVTGDKKEVYLSSFRRSNDDQIARFKAKGTLVRKGEV